MTTLTVRRDPDRLLEIDAPFTDFFRTLAGPWPFRTLVSGRHFMPAADIFARNEDLVLRLDLPGVDPKDVHVKLDEEGVTVTGERKADKEIKEEGYYRRESSYGFFERHLPVPRGTKETDIKAEFANGVLEVRVPRTAKANGPKPKEIAVKVGK